MSADFSQEEIQEFVTEALDLLNEAEDGLLKLEKNAPFNQVYDAIFRVFHSLKGGAGMLGLSLLQEHMHSLENSFTLCKKNGKITKPQISFFLQGVDASRKILSGENVKFDHTFPDSSDPEPKSATPTQSSSPAQEKDKKTTHSTSEPYVIAVDDEKEILELLQDFLLQSGYQCDTFENPKQAIDAVRKRQPDVVITDMSMPEMTGSDVLTEIKKINPDIPVIYLSGYLSKETLITGLDHGLYAAVEKPFKYNTILSYVHNATKHHKTVKILNRTINLIMYQFSDLDNYLKSQGKDDIRTAIKSELDTLLKLRQNLAKLSNQKI